jgi:hypothetical protein
MTELVNAKYFIEKTGFNSSWARKILTERLENKGVNNRFRMYDKEEVDEIIKEYRIAKEPKKEHEWDLSDIKNYFEVCATFAQRLARCDGFPEPVRKIIGEKPSNHKRLWLDSDIKQVIIKNYPEVWVRKTNKKPKETRLSNVEQQFLRGFRL